eukprot:CAMPEP_0116910626 /NCGR_PEP_ID=MMETSP0467-20121206/14997_1 /TAXON_ID=283647 /ORGANISM="Mesodinium pulex, Strain SPMC105" /LENGTH=120 /DNA_ID=CAMNT_0004586239 /DNA_START=364 /DNA_END=726 /DNA_ORIENTATION=-
MNRENHSTGNENQLEIMKSRQLFHSKSFTRFEQNSFTHNQHNSFCHSARSVVDVNLFVDQEMDNLKLKKDMSVHLGVLAVALVPSTIVAFSQLTRFDCLLAIFNLMVISVTLSVFGYCGV